MGEGALFRHRSEKLIKIYCALHHYIVLIANGFIVNMKLVVQIRFLIEYINLFKPNVIELETKLM